MLQHYRQSRCRAGSRCEHLRNASTRAFQVWIAKTVRGCGRQRPNCVVLTHSDAGCRCKTQFLEIAGVGLHNIDGHGKTRLFSDCCGCVVHRGRRRGEGESRHPRFGLPPTACSDSQPGESLLGFFFSFFPFFFPFFSSFPSADTERIHPADNPPAPRGVFWRAMPLQGCFQGIWAGQAISTKGFASS